MTEKKEKSGIGRLADTLNGGFGSGLALEYIVSRQNQFLGSEVCRG
jgi:hypothetical protein